METKSRTLNPEPYAPRLPEAFTQALKRLEHHVLDELSKVHHMINMEVFHQFSCESSC